MLSDEEITMESGHLSVEEVWYAHETAPHHFVSGYVEFARAIEAAVLAKLKQQEPVGTPATRIYGSADCTMAVFDSKDVPVGTRLYTHPALVQAQSEPPLFPTMLRKMWSGREVQEWINENWKAAPVQQDVNQQLLEALRVYATRGNWLSPSTGFAAQYDPIPSVISIDSGNIARAAIAQVEGK